MPDISICMNTSCPHNSTCHRYNAEPSEFWQSYSDFKPDPDSDECKHYWAMEKTDE